MRSYTILPEGYPARTADIGIYKTGRTGGILIKKLISLFCSALMIVLSAAFAGGAGAVTGEPSAKLRDIPVYRKSMSENETVSCLFFEDMPDVPYIAPDLYYSTFLDGRMTVTHDGEGRYVCLEQDFGDSAAFDTVKDTLTCGDLADFVSTPVFRLEDKDFVLGGPERLSRIKKVDYSRSAVEKTIDLGSYGIDLREYDGTVYIPFITACDLFNNTDVTTVCYSGGKIYFVSYYDEINGGDARDEDNGNLDWINNGSRPSGTIDLTYGELCMSVDNFYGYPSTQNEFSERVRLSGLDKALERYDPETKSLLLSSSPGKYLAGLYRLFNMWLADGGHSSLVLDSSFEKALSPSVYAEFSQGVAGLADKSFIYAAKYNGMLGEYHSLKNTRLSVLGDGSYHSSGNTAVISFDEFEFDQSGWERYFENGGEMPSDSVGIVARGLRQAESDPGIKNIILDVSANLGGDSIALEAIIGIIAGDFRLSAYNLLGEQYLSQVISSDRNLDGTIDANDEKVSYDKYNIAVLTSRSSFSCGNLLASLMKDAGYMTIGDTSGGGTCAILRRTTADGVMYQMSSYCKFVNNDLQPVDNGVEPDVSLVRVDDSGAQDYSPYYDINALGSAVEGYYSKHPLTKTDPDLPPFFEEVSSPGTLSAVSQDSPTEDSSALTSVPDSSGGSEVSGVPPLFSQTESESGGQESSVRVTVLIAVLGTAAVIILFAVIAAVSLRKKDKPGGL